VRRGLSAPPQIPPHPLPHPTRRPRSQALVAHLLNLWDKALMFRGAAKAAGSGPLRHALLTLALKGAARVARPVLLENISRWAPGRLSMLSF
jgi:hypothetical protein